MAEEMLDIVDEDDNVIGTASRKEAHAKGLLHREVFILFITPAGEIIFQRRSMTKATNPGLLAFTVGGHVESGQTYEDTVIREAKEETGLDIKSDDLIFLDKVMTNSVDRQTSVRNHAYQFIYGYIFKGQIGDLLVEDNEGDGFVLVPGKSMLNLTEQEKSRFASDAIGSNYDTTYKNLLVLMER